MRVEFRQWDVFTSRPLGGNPLGIFPDAAGIDGELMQSLTREMNLSECTFITGGGNGLYDVRIFTPGREMEFAGHPVVGTAAFVFTELEPDAQALTFRLRKGNVDIRRIEHQSERLVCFDSPAVRWHPALEDRQFAARLCGLETAQLDDSLPVGMLDVGPTYCIVPVMDRLALEAASCDVSQLRELYRQRGFDQLTVFCTEAYQPGAQFSCRMFAPEHGVVEDPATGSNACCMAEYLKRCGLLKLPEAEFQGIDQGFSMHRPSRIWFSVEGTEADRKIRIAGNALEVASGEFRI